MALMLIDSFGHYNNQTQAGRKWSQVNATVNFYSSGGRRNGAYANISTNGWLIFTFSNRSTFICGTAFRTPSYPSTNRQLFAFYDLAQLQCELRLGPNGVIFVTRATNNVASSSPGAYPANNTWCYIEFKCTISNSGYYEVRVNGVNVLSGTGNLRYTSNSYANGFRLGENLIGDVDDFYLCDNSGSINNDFLGDVKVELIMPNANGSNNGWTPSSGTDRYAVVNDNPPNDDTNYVYSNTSGDTFTVNLSNLTSVGLVRGVQVSVMNRKDDASSYQIRPAIRTNANNYLGSAQSVNDSYKCAMQIWEVNPYTGTNWTLSEINALEAGASLV